MPARGQSKKKNTTQGVFFFAPAPGKGRGRRSPVGRRHGARAKKKWPRAGAERGFSFPCLSPGPEQKKTPWVVFFCLLWPRRKVAAPNGAQQKKKHFAHPGPTAKNFLETNDAGHEQKGATTKKKHPGPLKVTHFGQKVLILVHVDRFGDQAPAANLLDARRGLGQACPDHRTQLVRRVYGMPLLC